MKKFVFFLLMVFAVFACTPDDEIKFEPFSLPIESVVIPDNWTLNEVGFITLTYTRPTSCDLFNGFNYQYTNEFIRTVSIEAIRLKETNCTDESQVDYQVDLKFQPVKVGIYHFRFWSGVDENGNNTFLEYDVDVQ